MSSPSLKAPPIVRWSSIVVVVVAIVVRFWPHAPGPAATGAAGAAADMRQPSAIAHETSAPARTFAASIGFRSQERLEEHFHKHGAEFKATSAADYLCLAQELRDKPAGGDVLETVRPDGTISRFDRASGAFLAFDSDGTIRTFFHPNDGERYFERQANRPHGAP